MFTEPDRIEVGVAPTRSLVEDAQVVGARAVGNSVHNSEELELDIARCANRYDWSEEETDVYGATAGFERGRFDLSVPAYERFLREAYRYKDGYEEKVAARLRQHVLICVQEAAQTNNLANLYPLADTVVSVLDWYSAEENQAHIFHCLPTQPRPFHTRWHDGRNIARGDFPGLIMLRPLFAEIAANTVGNEVD